MSRTFSLSVVVSLAACAVAYGCSSETGRSGFGDGTSSGSSGASSGILGGGEAGGGGKTCTPSPSNYDIPGNNCDDDGDGKIDNPPTCDDSLSQGGDGEDFARALGICQTAKTDGYGFVSAEFTQGYNRNDSPNSAQHGILSKFGNILKPREGERLGVLSSGYAQEYNGSGSAPFGGEAPTGKAWNPPVFSTTQGNGTAPPGFP